MTVDEVLSLDPEHPAISWNKDLHSLRESQLFGSMLSMESYTSQQLFPEPPEESQAEPQATMELFSQPIEDTLASQTKPSNLERTIIPETGPDGEMSAIASVPSDPSPPPAQQDRPTNNRQQHTTSQEQRYRPCQLGATHRLPPAPLPLSLPLYASPTFSTPSFMCCRTSTEEENNIPLSRLST